MTMWTLTYTFVISASLFLCFSETDLENCANPCALNPCRNNSTCVEDSTCKARCICPDEFIGDTCQHEIDNDANTSVTFQIMKSFPVRDRLCRDTGLVCVHGTCSLFGDAKLRCHCSKGWVGPLCDIKLNSTKQTENNSSKSTVLSEQSSLAVAKSKTISPIGRSDISNPFHVLLEAFKDTSRDATTFIPAIADETTLELSYNVCKAEPLRRSMVDRQCRNTDLVCEFGVCGHEVVDHGTFKGHKYVCVCDIGARGIYFSFL